MAGDSFVRFPKFLKCSLCVRDPPCSTYFRGQCWCNLQDFEGILQTTFLKKSELIVLRPYIFALYRLTRARQKPGTGETPYSSRFIPRGLLGARTIDSPIHHWAFIYFSSSSAHWNTPPARFEPMTFRSCAQRSTMLPPAGDLRRVKTLS